jgi:hypothetical protein
MEDKMITNIEELNKRYNMLSTLQIGGNVKYLMSIIEYSDDILTKVNNLGYIDWEIYLKTFKVDPVVFENILAFNSEMVNIYKISKDEIVTMKNSWLKKENWSDSLTLMARLLKGEEE